MHIAKSHHKCRIISTQTKNMSLKTCTHINTYLYIYIYTYITYIHTYVQCIQQKQAAARTSSPLPRMENGISCARSWDAIPAMPGSESTARHGAARRGNVSKVSAMESEEKKTIDWIRIKWISID